MEPTELSTGTAVSDFSSVTYPANVAQRSSLSTMTSQPPEPTAAQPFVRAAGAPRESGLGDQAIQTILLRRQVSELERRLQVLTEGERTARAALLESMGQSQASAREQARLHEELAAREHVVSNVLAREAGLQAELAQSRANLRRTELALERAQTCSDATPAAEAALTTSLLAELQLNAKLEGLSDHVATKGARSQRTP